MPVKEISSFQFSSVALKIHHFEMAGILYLLCGICQQFLRENLNVLNLHEVHTLYLVFLLTGTISSSFWLLRTWLPPCLFWLCMILLVSENEIAPIRALFPGYS